MEEKLGKVKLGGMSVLLREGSNSIYSSISRVLMGVWRVLRGGMGGGKVRV